MPSLARAVAYAAVFSTTVFPLASPSRARAAEPEAPAASDTPPTVATPDRDARVQLDDEDPAALFELRSEGGELSRCVGRCALRTARGRYHVRIAHGSSVDERDVTIDGDARLRSRASSYVGAAIGVPLIVAGALSTAIGGVAFLVADFSPPDKRAMQIGGGVAFGLGLVSVASGIVLVGTSHGALFRLDPDPRPSGPTATLSVVPTSAGAALSLAGRF